MQSAFTIGRIDLRLLCEVDEKLYCNLYADAETMRFIGPPLSIERAAKSFRMALSLIRREPVRHLFFAVVETATQRAIGIGSLQQIDPVRRRAEVGIMIEARYRARGFATDGLTALVAYAHAKLPVDEVWAQIAAAHTVVERLVISVGFSPSGEVAEDGLSGWRIWSAHSQSWRRHDAS